MPSLDFSRAFKALTGSLPFPWQSALYGELSAGCVPSAACIPTGLGKTSIVAIWLIALAQHSERVPRRLVYVVNRRTVVDQTTAEATKWRTQLQSSPELRELRDRLASLRAIPITASGEADDSNPLAISTLRGQFADNREWSADPARPAVIIGTVDMIGSGLLFSRYTVGFKLRPHHAALLAQDALLVHDEAHLEPAFQKLLESISNAQNASADPRKLRVIALTATSRGSSDSTPPFGLTDDDKNSRIEDGVEKNIVLFRYHATKRLRLASVAADKDVRTEIVRLALEKRDPARAVLIFVRSVKMAEEIAAELGGKLGKEGGLKVATLTGTMRGKERDELVSGDSAAARVFRRFLPEGDHSANAFPSADTVYLVATSAGEVGVNISADHLVCDLSTYESVAQRFGRVNRFGLRSDTKITVVHAEDMQTEYDDGLAKARNAPKDAAKKVKAYEDKNKIILPLLKTLELLRQLAALNNGLGDASPAALDTLPTTARAAAFSPLPEIRVATAVQFDAWALTSIREPIAARPPVAPYLHGESEWEPPETHVAWREEVQRLAKSTLLESYSPEELLEDFPLQPHELLRDTTGRIFDRILKIAEKLQKNRDKIPDAWIVHEEGKVEVFSLSSLLTDDDPEADDTDEEESKGDESSGNISGDKAEKDTANRRKDRFVARLADRTLILPPSFGGLSAQGFLSNGNDDADSVVVLDVSAAPLALGLKPGRKRVWSDTPIISPENAVGYRLVRVIDTGLGSEDLSDDEDDTGDDTDGTKGRSARTSRYWLWLEAKNVIGAERRFSANTAQPETLADHTRAVEGHARAIAAKLLPASVDGEPDLRRCLVLAATFHDLGKNRRQWQRGIGNLDYDPSKPETIFAKSGGKIRPRILAEHYRHEFGSLADTDTDAKIISELTSLSELERDIVLHLVAAHHGRARPHFPADEILDYSPTTSPERAALIATEVPRRFARLQHRFGRWGLAWLESLLRAADYAASAAIAPQDSPDSEAWTQSFNKSATVKSEKHTAPAPSAKISLRLNPANPGHYFACCGLFEFAAALDPEACAWFAKDGSIFHITNSTSSLAELLNKIVTAEIIALDSEDRPLTPLLISLIGSDAKQRNIRIDWWRHEGSLIGKLKPWAGQMSVRDIADDMRETLKREFTKHASVAPEDVLFYSSTENVGEPFYFDANRATNAKAQDVGFSVDKLKKGSVKITSTASPAVELLCLAGLQRARPLLSFNERGKERAYDYHIWHGPLNIPLLASAVTGMLPDSTYCFRFSNPSRAKDYRAFAPANRIS